MIPGARLIILGRQGAGKGTQCVRLSRHYVVPHISTGDMLRAAVKEGTDARARRPRSYMDGGELVPDDVMIGIVERAARQATTPAPRGFILDGFPRTVAQAEALARSPPSSPSTSSSTSRCPASWCSSGWPRRRVCQDCGTNYTATGPERLPWICDVCGGDVVQRDDDTEEAINRRLDLYESQTSPLIEFYDARSACSRWSTASGSPDDVLRPHGEGRRGPPRRPASRGAMSLRRGAHADELAGDARAPAGWWPRCTPSIRAAIRPGVTTADLDRIGRDVLDRRGARSNFLGYHGYPAVICACVNDVVIHGIPGRRGWTRATSCRSTAAPSSTAGTATPPSPSGSGRCRPTVSG